MEEYFQGIFDQFFDQFTCYKSVNYVGCLYLIGANGQASAAFRAEDFEKGVSRSEIFFRIWSLGMSVDALFCAGPTDLLGREDQAGQRFCAISADACPFMRRPTEGRFAHER